MKYIKPIVFVVIVIAILTGVRYLIISDAKQSLSKKDIETTIRKNKINTIIDTYIEKYGAKDASKIDFAFTSQLEDILITDDGPVIIKAGISDIFRANGEYFLRFEQSWDPHIFYTLSGCAHKVDELLKRGNNLWSDDYIVVAKVTQVERPIATSDDEVEFELAPTHLATGSCLDMEYIGD